MLPRIPLLLLFAIFLKVGGLSFGGGPVGWVHREVVTLRGWLTELPIPGLWDGSSPSLPAQCWRGARDFSPSSCSRSGAPSS
jgi:hypothetical protein